jgi:NAD-dependent SIR2 family protein deacetylase
MRQHVLWFDEHYGSHADYQFDRVLDFLGCAGVIVCIGTSFAVGVTDIVVTTADQRRVPVFVVDPRAAPFDPDARRFHIAAPAEIILPFVCELLGASGREGPPAAGAGT